MNPDAINQIRSRAARLVAPRLGGMVASEERERTSRLHELARVDVPALCDALEAAMAWSDNWRATAERLAARVARTIDERDQARSLNADAAKMLRRLGPVGHEYCMVCGDVHMPDCAFVALLKKLEESNG